MKPDRTEGGTRGPQLPEPSAPNYEHEPAMKVVIDRWAGCFGCGPCFDRRVTCLEFAIDEQDAPGSQDENRLTYCSSFTSDRCGRSHSRLCLGSCWSSGNAKGGDICPNRQEPA